MIKIPVVVAVLAAFLGASTAWTATYYVSPTGNDNNAGTSSGAPWKTLAKVNGRSFSPGDRILLARGGTWREQLNPPSSGTSAAPITFGTYGTGAKPRIWGAARLTEFYSYQTTVWRAAHNRRPNVVYFGDTRGLPRSSIAQLTAPFTYYWASGVLYFYSAGNPASYYPSVEASVYTREYAINTNGRSWLVFDGLELGRADYITFSVYGGTGITIRNCDVHASRRDWPNLRVSAHASHVTVDQCVFGRPADDGLSGKRLADFGSVGPIGAGGHWTVKNSRFYWTTENDTGLVGTDHGLAFHNARVGDVLVDNCQVYDVEDSGIYFSGNDTAGTLTVQNCHVARAGNAGIATWNQKGARMGAILIRNNLVQDSAFGHNDAMGIHVNSTWNPTVVEHNRVFGCRNLSANAEDGGGIGVDADSRNATVRYNRVHDNWGKGIYVYGIGGPSSNHKIHHNLVYRNDCGIAVSGNSNAVVSDVEVFNNTCYLNYNGPEQGPGYDAEIVIGPHAQNVKLRNNILYAHASGHGLRRFAVNVTGLDSDYNSFFGATQNLIGLCSNGGPLTLAGWQSLGLDAHSAWHDPRFAAAEAGDFGLAADSPCIDAGAPVGINVDLAGVPIPQGPAPDRGGLERLAAAPTTTTTPTPTPTPTSTSTPTSTPTPTPTWTATPTATPIPLPPTAGHDEWAVVWSVSEQTGFESPRLNSLPARNYRNWIRGENIRVSVGEVRVRLRGSGGSRDTVLESVTLGGRHPETTACSFDGPAALALRFGGQRRAVIPAGGTLVSDPVEIAFGPGQDYIVALYHPDNQLISYWTSAADVHAHHRATDVDETGIVNVSGYHPSSNVFIVEAIEGRSAAAAPPAATWSELWTAAAQTGAESVGLNSLTDRNYRNWIKGGEVGGSAPWIRLRLRSGSRLSATFVDAAAIGVKGAGSSFAAPPMRVTFGGSPSVELPASGVVLSDPLPFPIETGRDYLVAFYLEGRELVSLWSQSGSANSFSRTVTRDESGELDPPGYVPLSSIYLLEAIEGSPAP